MSNFNRAMFDAWLGQVTTGHGFMALSGAAAGLWSGHMSLATAVPLLLGGLVGLIWPEKPALAHDVESVTVDFTDALAELGYVKREDVQVANGPTPRAADTNWSMVDPNTLAPDPRGGFLNLGCQGTLTPTPGTMAGPARGPMAGVAASDVEKRAKSPETIDAQLLAGVWRTPTAPAMVAAIALTLSLTLAACQGKMTAREAEADACVVGAALQPVADALAAPAVAKATAGLTDAERAAVAAVDVAVRERIKRACQALQSDPAPVVNGDRQGS